MFFTICVRLIVLAQGRNTCACLFTKYVYLRQTFSERSTPLESTPHSQAGETCEGSCVLSLMEQKVLIWMKCVIRIPERFKG